MMKKLIKFIAGLAATATMLFVGCTNQLDYVEDNTAINKFKIAGLYVEGLDESYNGASAQLMIVNPGEESDKGSIAGEAGTVAYSYKKGDDTVGYQSGSVYKEFSEPFIYDLDKINKEWFNNPDNKFQSTASQMECYLQVADDQIKILSADGVKLENARLAIPTSPAGTSDAKLVKKWVKVVVKDGVGTFCFVDSIAEPVNLTLTCISMDISEYTEETDAVKFSTVAKTGAYPKYTLKVIGLEADQIGMEVQLAGATLGSAEPNEEVDNTKMGDYWAGGPADVIGSEAQLKSSFVKTITKTKDKETGEVQWIFYGTTPSWASKKGPAIKIYKAGFKDEVFFLKTGKTDNFFFPASTWGTAGDYDVNCTIDVSKLKKGEDYEKADPVAKKSIIYIDGYKIINAPAPNAQNVYINSGSGDQPWMDWVPGNAWGNKSPKYTKDPNGFMSSEATIKSSGNYIKMFSKKSEDGAIELDPVNVIPEGATFNLGVQLINPEVARDSNNFPIFLKFFAAKKIENIDGSVKYYKNDEAYNVDQGNSDDYICYEVTAVQETVNATDYGETKATEHLVYGYASYDKDDNLLTHRPWDPYGNFIMVITGKDANGKLKYKQKSASNPSVDYGEGTKCFSGDDDKGNLPIQDLPVYDDNGVRVYEFEDPNPKNPASAETFETATEWGYWTKETKPTWKTVEKSKFPKTDAEKNAQKLETGIYTKDAEPDAYHGVRCWTLKQKVDGVEQTYKVYPRFYYEDADGKKQYPSNEDCDADIVDRISDVGATPKKEESSFGYGLFKKCIILNADPDKRDIHVIDVVPVYKYVYTKYTAKTAIGEAYAAGDVIPKDVATDKNSDKEEIIIRAYYDDGGSGDCKDKIASNIIDKDGKVVLKNSNVRLPYKENAVGDKAFWADDHKVAGGGVFTPNYATKDFAGNHYIFVMTYKNKLLHVQLEPSNFVETEIDANFENIVINTKDMKAETKAKFISDGASKVGIIGDLTGWAADLSGTVKGDLIIFDVSSYSTATLNNTWKIRTIGTWEGDVNIGNKAGVNFTTASVVADGDYDLWLTDIDMEDTTNGCKGTADLVAKAYPSTN